MQGTGPTKTTGYQGFKARTGNTAPAARATTNSSAAASASGDEKKSTGEVIFRVKRKATDGELNFQGQPAKWVTLGNLYKNIDKETGDVFYSLHVKEPIGAGLHRVYENTPVDAK